MNLEDITQLIDKKIATNENKVLVTYYELKVNKNLNEEEIASVLYLISVRLNNLGYNVYKENEKYTYNGIECIVERNELLVGIKV
jgi:hypothetical protein